MIETKNIRVVAILSLAIVGFGSPVHACGLHGDFDAGFGMQRFNPFQAEPYDNSSSWSASLNQDRKMTPLPKKQDLDKEPAEETWNDKQKPDEQQNLTSGTSSDSAADRAMFQ